MWDGRIKYIDIETYPPAPCKSKESLIHQKKFEREVALV